MLALQTPPRGGTAVPTPIRICFIVTTSIDDPIRLDAIAECARGPAVPLSTAELAFAVRHGLAPQLYRNAPGLRPALEERFQQNLRRSLVLTSELLRLLDALPPALAFKGPALAQRLYGDFAGREYCDLDLVFRPADVLPAILALRRIGYSGLGLDPWQLRSHLRNGCEYPMSDDRVHVELHWQFAPRQFGALFDIDKLFARSCNIRISERDVPALSPEDDFLMLVVHGTKHAWARLAWVADLAALLRRSQLDWDYIRSEARRMRMMRMVRVALVLSGWMGAPLPDAMRHEIAHDPQALTVAGHMKDYIAQLNQPGLEDRAEHRLVAATLDSAADRLAYAARYAITPTIADWSFLRLPRGLRWLYPAVRLLRLATQKT
ncbi:MAG TPA: nucleotidyltransferase family protein [Terriglobales bacterium]|nr:nucleotidyltransferase family protein [Terriglobales bacterium]